MAGHFSIVEAWRIGTEWGWSGPLELFLELGRAFPAAPP